MSPSLVLALAFALLLAWPYTLYPLILALLPRQPLPPAAPRPAARCALLFAARDEAAVLPRTLARLAEVKAAFPALQIRAHDDGSRDATRALLAARPDLLSLSHSDTPMGKPAALNRLVAATDAEVLILMDANSLPAPDAPARLAARLADPSIGAAAATLGHDAPAAVTARYWRLEEALKRRETATGSTIGCDGALWAIRRALCPRFADAACDDFRASMEALLQGYRVVSDPAARVTEAADPDRRAARRLRRIARGAWHAHRAIAPRLGTLSRLDRFKYLSHKLIRWFSGLWFAGLALSLLAWVHHAGLHLPAGGVLIALAAASLAGPLRRPAVAVAGLVAVTLGVLDAMRGGAEPAWVPVR